MRYWLRDHQIEARAALELLSQLLREWTFATTMRKHGISFDEAGSAFRDQLALSGPVPITRWVSRATLPSECPFELSELFEFELN